MANLLYVDGDKNKTPVVLADQPAGTRLVLVTDSGRDVHFAAGKRRTNDMAARKTRFTKGRQGGHAEG